MKHSLDNHTCGTYTRPTLADGLSVLKQKASTVDKMVYCVTIVVLQLLIAPQLCEELSASNEKYVELNVILHQKSKFLNTIVCYLVATRCFKQNKYSSLEKPSQGHGPS